MKLIGTLTVLSLILNSSIIFDFNSKSNLKNWKIVDDVVMGGRSSGNFKLDSNHNGVFYGTVSTKNYGGFSSVRYNFNTVSFKNKTKVSIRLKGDSKKYQFRIKNNKNLRYSFIQEFKTNGKWQTITLKLSDFYPSFRGRKLDKPNFSDKQLEEIAILIGNKKNESFKLVIDSIKLE